MESERVRPLSPANVATTGNCMAYTQRERYQELAKAEADTKMTTENPTQLNQVSSFFREKMAAHGLVSKSVLTSEVPLLKNIIGRT